MIKIKDWLLGRDVSNDMGGAYLVSFIRIVVSAAVVLGLIILTINKYLL